MCQGDGSVDTFLQMEASVLSIWRKQAQPASSRSKAVDSTAAHRFQTGRCNGCVFPVSDKPDRFYYYYDICPILHDKYKNVICSWMMKFLNIACCYNLPASHSNYTLYRSTCF